MESFTNISPLDSFFIVGIGASAGGLEAINEFFDNVPQDQNHCAYVVIQHLSPDYKSLMPELLAKHTRIKIQVAEDNMFVKPGNIYLIPHKKNMTIEYGKLKLKDKEPGHAPNMTIDIFLRSLAEYKKEKSIGVILSGTGSDGTRGIEAIHRMGGMVFVQDPVTAKFDGMPNSAIASGVVDFILAPEMMPEEIINLSGGGKPEKFPFPNLESYEEEVLHEILNSVLKHTGKDFTNYKRPTLLRRLAKRLAFRKISTLENYRDYLVGHPEEVLLLSKEFLIGVTRFFRDSAVFDYLQRKLIPEIINTKYQVHEPVKIWVAGCSTGEEAYSMAILFREYMQAVKKEVEVKIFATDIDREAVEYAAKGIFPERISQEISPERLKHFFERNGDQYKVSPAIRKMIIFATHDLIKDAPFSKMDMVSCRNMLIYLNSAQQKKIFSKFHFSLNYGGYLLLGSSENIGEFSGVFREEHKKFKIFKNIQEEKKLTYESFQISAPMASNSADRAGAVGKAPGHLQITEAVNETLMNLSGYSSIVTNDSFELIHCSGDYKKFLYLPEKTLDLNLLKMVPEDLSMLLSAAVRSAIRQKTRVTMNNSLIYEKERARYIDLVVEPYSQPVRGKNTVIVLIREKQVDKAIGNPSLSQNEASYAELQELRRELRESKELMQSMVEELETGNEEMQSTNEELVSSNEELQSTNEELQSLNEELHTVNSEYQQKIKELLELNDDLNNYFRSTDIGQVFVDGNLIIRKFTPAVKDQINLIEKDIGRPISHISSNIRYPQLLEDIEKVAAGGDAVNQEVQSQDGKWYQMKVIPYVRHDKVTNGVIIAFVDIDKLKLLNEHLSGILTGSQEGIMTLKSIRDEEGAVTDFEWRLLNPAGEKILGKKEGELTGKKFLTEKLPSEFRHLAGKLIKVAEGGEHLLTEHFFEEDGRKGWLKIAAVGMIDGVAVTFSDITETKLSQERIRNAFHELNQAQEGLQKLNNELERRVEQRTRELSQSEERFRLLSLATNDAIWDWDFVSKTVWWNEGFRKIFGYSQEEEAKASAIDFLFNKIHPEDRDSVIQGIQDAITQGRKTWSGEYRMLRADDTFAYVLDRAYVLYSEESRMPYRMIGSMIDLTNLKKTQMQLELSNDSLRRINNDLDNFIYTASHDLKAPISNIEGLINSMEEILPQGEDGELKEMIGLIKFSIDKFKNTIKDLTEIAKTQKDNVEDLESIDLQEMSEEIQFSIKDMFVKSNAVINFRLEEPLVLFSRKNLRSILYNLISNAIKYRAPDRDPVITISSEKTATHTLVTVADNGLGIPKDKHGRVFEMFKRFHMHVEGTGIGLYIVKRMMENSGGRIEMESEPGKGTCFKLYFINSVPIKQKIKDTLSSKSD